jgi:hypothetical protein
MPFGIRKKDDDDYLFDKVDDHDVVFEEDTIPEVRKSLERKLPYLYLTM